MELRRYDGRRIQITTPWGEKFEGVCDHCSADYCEHEYGRAEEALKLVNFLFFPGDIRAVRDLEEQPGPYGGFTAPYGRIEETNLRDGIDFIRDQLTCEEDLHALRMLRCLEAWRDKRRSFPGRDQVPDALREALSFIEDPEIRQEVRRLMETWK